MLFVAINMVYKQETKSKIMVNAKVSYRFIVLISES